MEAAEAADHELLNHYYVSEDHNNNNNKDNLWDLFRLPSAPRINSAPHPADPPAVAVADIHRHYLYYYHHIPLYSMDAGGDYHVHAEAHQQHQLHVTNVGAQVVAGMRGTSDRIMNSPVLLLDDADNNNNSIPDFVRRSSPAGLLNHSSSSSDPSYVGALSSIQSHLLFSGVDDASTSSAAAEAELGLIRCSNSDHHDPSGHGAFISPGGGKNSRFSTDAILQSMTTTAITTETIAAGGGILDLLKSTSANYHHHHHNDDIISYGSSTLADLAAAADLLQQQQQQSYCHPSSQFITGTSAAASHYNQRKHITNSSDNNNIHMMMMMMSTPAAAGPFPYRSDPATITSPPTKDHAFGCTSHPSEYQSPPSEYLIRNPNELLIMDGGKLQNDVNPHRFYNLPGAAAAAGGPNMGFECGAATTTTTGVDEDGDGEEMLLFSNNNNHAMGDASDRQQRLMMMMMMGGDPAMDMKARSGGEESKAMMMMMKGSIDQSAAAGSAGGEEGIGRSDEMDMEEQELQEQEQEQEEDLEEEDVVNMNSNKKKTNSKKKQQQQEAVVASNSMKGKGKGNGGPPAKNLMAERRRRKKLNDRLYTLRSVVPNISKMDRASILGDAIEYLKELLQRINDLHNELETIPGAAEHHSPMQAMDTQQHHQNHPTTASSVAEHHHLFRSPSGNMPNVNILPPCIKLEDCVTDLEQPSSSGIASMHFSDGPHDPSQPPEIDVRIRDGKVLNIHMLCARRPGLLLSTMRALDSLGLDIQQAVISCFSGFALDVFRADREQSNENDVAVEEDIKRVLLLTATSPASDV